MLEAGLGVYAQKEVITLQEQGIPWSQAKRGECMPDYN